MNVNFKLCEDYQNMRQEGRVYTPLTHHMDVNRAWMLAQIHAGRSFRLLSDLKFYNMNRSKKKNERSAFSQEVSAAFLAGYRFSHEEIYNKTMTDILTPTLDKQKNVSIDYSRY